MPLYQAFSSLLTSEKATYPVVTPRNNPQNTIIYRNADMSYDLRDTNFQVNHDKSVYRIPLYLLSASDYENINKFQSHFATVLAQNKDYTLLVSMPVHAVKLSYNAYGFKHNLKDVTFMYEPTLWFKYKDHNDYVKLDKDSVKTKQSFVTKGFTINPKKWFEDNLKLAKNFNYQDNFNRFWQNYDLANQLNAQITLMQTHLADLFKLYGTNCAWSVNILNNCSNYELPLMQYKAVYDVLKKLGITNADYNKIVSTNEYLLLISNIEDLYKAKDKLPTVKSMPIQNSKYNQQQLLAIESDKPLNLLQSVAGSGKSTTILGRIKYLLNQNIDPETITVLSFTNAAANHITHSFDQPINSLTIAKLIHDIYQANWSHHLSNTATLINSLYLNYGEADPLINQFVEQLSAMESNQKQASIKALHFITEHENKIIDILNNIGQTTLTLEEIFCYLHINNWKNPYKTKYLIVDEVQDTSIFQFIYLLRYATFNQANVFFVGDASQTLYEFRDADPDALNALEATNYFTTFQLETNYRSNPAILLYANQILNTVSANKYARLQLHSSGYSPTGQSNTQTPLTLPIFKSLVNYWHYPTAKMRINDLTNILDAKKWWFDTQLAKGQQIAVLTRSRRLADQACAVLQDMYPGKIVNNITSKPQAELTILSNYLRLYGTEIDYMPTDNLIQFLFIAIRDKLASLFPSGMYDSAKKLLLPEIAEMLNQLEQNLNTDYPRFLKSYRDGTFNHKQLANRVRKYLLNFEINFNLDIQDDIDESTTAISKIIAKSNIVTSTVHGTKGLEFDNTVLLLTNTARLTQADRRVMYVASTRARNHELIIEVSDAMHDPAKFYQQSENLL